VFLGYDLPCFHVAWHTLALQIVDYRIFIGHWFIPNVTGSNHPTATRGNQIKKSMERIEIPE
jgi:hypothetical protein